MFLQGVLSGIVVCAVLALLVVLVVYQVQNAFVSRVVEKTNRFTADAHADIEAFKEGVAGAIKDNTEKLTRLIVDTKKDVEIMKTRVGGAFTLPPANGKVLTGAKSGSADSAEGAPR